jgi:protocatechuate 3,4-dioxygenase beta subunit
VDLWQADAAGVYSDEGVENTTGQTYLRGYQLTNSSGVVNFKTIFPGWYAGRTAHIHVMIRTFTSTGATALDFTTQLFFDQTLIDAIATTVAPYSSRGLPDTTNAQDGIYNSATQMTLTTSSSGGYAGAMTLGVQV